MDREGHSGRIDITVDSYYCITRAESAMLERRADSQEGHLAYDREVIGIYPLHSATHAV